LESHESANSSTSFEIVVIGSSLGGPEALSALLGGLPSEFPVPILICQHRSPAIRSYLVDMLDKVTALTVQGARNGEMPRAGSAYLAPPDHHLRLATDGTLSLDQRPQVQWSRPSVDVLFTSVANHFGPRAIGVVMTGLQHDGAAGARMIKERGGCVLVQDPSTARCAGMPNATLATGCVDFVLAPKMLAQALILLTMVPGGEDYLNVHRTASATLLPGMMPAAS